VGSKLARVGGKRGEGKQKVIRVRRGGKAGVVAKPAQGRTRTQNGLKKERGRGDPGTKQPIQLIFDIRSSQGERESERAEPGTSGQLVEVRPCRQTVTSKGPEKKRLAPKGAQSDSPREKGASRLEPCSPKTLNGKGRGSEM